jgi:hypothetical protein
MGGNTMGCELQYEGDTEWGCYASVTKKYHFPIVDLGYLLILVIGS